MVVRVVSTVNVFFDVDLKLLLPKLLLLLGVCIFPLFNLEIGPDQGRLGLFLNTFHIFNFQFDLSHLCFR